MAGKASRTWFSIDYQGIADHGIQAREVRDPWSKGTVGHGPESSHWRDGIVAEGQKGRERGYMEWEVLVPTLLV